MFRAVPLLAARHFQLRACEVDRTLLFDAKYFTILGLTRDEALTGPFPGACRMSLPTIIKQPSAFLPVAMSLAALVTLIVALAMGGVARETDEGTAAHIWQLLMGGQTPIVAYFAIKWLPQAPRQALYVLALQVALALAAMAPVYLLHL
jgi:hypothetical protein